MKNILKKILTGNIELKLPYKTVVLPDVWVIGFATIFSVISYYIFLRMNVIVAYNDARAHMDMARLVVDNLKPGLAQIGSVWLPLDHLLKLTLVWNYTLWQSGFAGSIWSMISYVATVYVIYVFIKHVMHDRFVAFLGMLLFATNLNVLYMQATPMTELLLLLFFTAASYTFYKWTEDKKTINLIAPAFWTFLATLTRYDGWFLFASLLLALTIITGKDYLKDKASATKNKLDSYRWLLEGRILFFSALGGLGIVAWFVWNLVIFGDPLYFALGPYSAHAQQAKIDAAGALVSKWNVLLSLKIYWLAMIDNIGFVVVGIAILGLLFYIAKNKLSDRAVATYTLLTPFAFHVISLIIGFSILIVPELGVKITTDAKSSWFNVRYGLMILPAVAFYASYFVRKSTILKALLFVVILAQFFSFIKTQNIITLTDGVIGTSSLNVGDVRDYLVTHAKGKDGLILTSIAFNNALAFSTGIPLSHFIHEGTGDYWTNALADPRREAEWIIMANGDVGDQVYEALIKKGKSQFLHNYDLKYQGQHTNVYQRKPEPQDFVVMDGPALLINNRDFRFIGVNSYDLAYQNHATIDKTMRLASENGIKVIRFWAFGEGENDSFQEKPGTYNQDKLDTLAYIVDRARKYDLKLVVTLSNFWADYGGVPQYLKWHNLEYTTPEEKDVFFTNEEIKNDYKDYVSEVLNYTSKYNQKKLKSSSTIMAWELMNEPRSSSGATSDNVTNWMSEMTAYIQKIDSKHIVSLGTEGFTGIYNTGDVGPYLQSVASLAPGAIPTAHFYSQYERQATSVVMEDWSNQVQKNAAKPLVIGEVGFEKKASKNGGVAREKSLQNMLDLAQKERVDGILLWNFALAKDTSFGISPLDPKDKAMLQIIKNYSQLVEDVATSNK